VLWQEGTYILSQSFNSITHFHKRDRLPAPFAIVVFHCCCLPWLQLLSKDFLIKGIKAKDSQSSILKNLSKSIWKEGNKSK
jgi:hypothetical protein